MGTEISSRLLLPPGGTWPDRKGEALAMAVLARGGAVGLAFASVADALACKRRLEGKAS